MGTEIDDTQLRRFVVRVQTADGESPLGTGVLVAPGWVLTCAHVVEGLNDVRLVPDRGAGIDDAGEPPGNAPPAHVPAAVRARSTPRDPAQRTAFWPFPDLAVLELDGWTSHVCAPLVTAEPVRTSQPHAWGFGRREDDVTSPGGAASFTYVGTDGDGYLALKAGDAAPGLSGAPLVCPQRRGVVALASVSRDPRDARGGWASPVSALAGGGLPGDLALVGGQVLALNREQAWRHRDDWNRVLPVPDAELTVDRPWEGLEFERPAAPSLLLRAEFGIVSYSFRGLDLAAARDWCRTRPRFAISYIDAQGGAGKTRFGIELCKAMSARGWLAGFLPKTGRGWTPCRWPGSWSSTTLRNARRRSSPISSPRWSARRPRSPRSGCCCSADRRPQPRGPGTGTAARTARCVRSGAASRGHGQRPVGGGVGPGARRPGRAVPGRAHRVRPRLARRRLDAARDRRGRPVSGAVRLAARCAAGGIRRGTVGAALATHCPAACGPCARPRVQALGGTDARLPRASTAGMRGAGYPGRRPQRRRGGRPARPGAGSGRRTGGRRAAPGR